MTLNELYECEKFFNTKLMQNPTIWESASRPLFVRTVWLESTDLRRGLQRHFLLDYETKRPLERLKSSNNPIQDRRKDIYKRSISYELNDSTDLVDDSVDQEIADDDDDIFLIGSAKLKLHEPQKSDLAKNRWKSNKSRRRSSILSRNYQSYESYYNSQYPNRRPSNISEYYSRRSSLQDLLPPTISETADERLAERVLNWLDLAGKEEFLKNLKNLQEMEVKLTKSSKLRQDSIKRNASKSNNLNTFTQKSKNSKLKTSQRSSNETCQSHRSLKGTEAVKHITIIFNKEGQPIRFNRPAKNIDLYTHSASPSMTRRLAGSLASARLYKSAENARNLQYQKTKATNCQKSISARRRLDTVADLTNSTLQQRLQETPIKTNCKIMHDAKKQLHIFMPTLPKKGLATVSNIGQGTEDGELSELSHNFSELCRI